MKKESQAFTSADAQTFFDEILAVDARHTAARLRAAGERLSELATRIPEHRGDDGEWNAKEVLVHIAILSRAWGVLGTMVAKGRLPELNLASIITQRDSFMEAMTEQSVGEIVAEIKAQHEKTLAFLDAATPEQLRTECRTENGTATAESLIRLTVVAHTEQHIEQLEAALAERQAAAATA